MHLTLNPVWLPWQLSVWRMLRKQRRLLAFWLVLLLLASGVAVALWPPAYRAQATVLVVPQNVPEQYVTSAASANVQERLAAISKQVLSSARLEKIIQAHSLYQRQRRWKTNEEILERMRSDIRIELEKSWGRGSAGSFKISYLGENPQVAMEVTAHIGSFFIEENFRSREDNAQGTSEFLNDSVEKARRQLEELEARLVDYRKRHGGPAAQQEATLLGQIQQLDRERQSSEDAVTRARRERTEAEAFLFTVESSPGLASAPPPPPDSPFEPSDLERARTQLRMLETRYSPAHPDVLAARRMLAELERSRPGRKERPALPAPAQPRDRDATQRLIALRLRREQAAEQAERADAERQRLVRELAALRSRLASLPVEEQELATLIRDYDVSKSHYAALLDKRFAAEMAADLEHRQKAERFVMIDPPRLPEKAQSPNRPLLAVGLGLLSLVLSPAFALLPEWKRNRLLGPWELPEGIAIIGRLQLAPPPAASFLRVRWWELAGPVSVLSCACAVWLLRQKGWL